MSRKSKLEPVREFLEEAKTAAFKEEVKASQEKRYHFAAVYGSFVDVLERALELCGEEKPKEGKDGA